MEYHNDNVKKYMSILARESLGVAHQTLGGKEVGNSKFTSAVLPQRYFHCP